MHTIELFDKGLRSFDRVVLCNQFQKIMPEKTDLKQTPKGQWHMAHTELENYDETYWMMTKLIK